MATTPLLAAFEGQMDTIGQFNMSDDFGITIGAPNDMAIFQFAPSNPNTTYWLEGSTTTTSELAVTFTVGATGSFGAPYWVVVVAHTNGQLAGFPASGIDLPREWNVEPSLDGSFTPPTLHYIPTTGTKGRGVLAGKKLVTADPGLGGTIIVPLDWAALIPAITDQSWTGHINLLVWLERSTGSATPTLDIVSQYTTSATLALSTETLSVPNRDTGRQVGKGVDGPFRRCPVTGFAHLVNRMVPDGWREGTLVSPRAWDPEEPEPRPDLGPDVWGTDDF